MRTSLALTIGAAVLVAGCALKEPPAPAPQAQVKEEYMLIRPPDTVAVIDLMEVVTYMPDGDDRIPVEHLNGASEAERTAAKALFAALVEKPSVQAKAEFLAYQSVDRDAPVDAWQQVRRFESRDKCEHTKGELQEITKLHSKRITYEQNMLLHDLQFHLLAASFGLSECVPVSSLPRITES